MRVTDLLAIYGYTEEGGRTARTDRIDMDALRRVVIRRLSGQIADSAFGSAVCDWEGTVNPEPWEYRGMVTYMNPQSQSYSQSTTYSRSTLARPMDADLVAASVPGRIYNPGKRTSR